MSISDGARANFLDAARAELAAAEAEAQAWDDAWNAFEEERKRRMPKCRPHAELAALREFVHRMVLIQKVGGP